MELFHQDIRRNKVVALLTNLNNIEKKIKKGSLPLDKAAELSLQAHFIKQKLNKLANLSQHVV
jgi:hypothetical protein